MAATVSQRPLTQLNHDIEAAEAEAARLQGERQELAKDASRSRRKLRLLQLAQSVRRPKATIEMWPTMLLLVGPAIAGVILFIVVHFIFDSVSLALLGLLIGIAGAAAAIASLLYRPPDALLPSTIAEAEAFDRLTDACLSEKVERITETTGRLQRLLDERRDQIASGKLQKAALLQRNWKAMRETEWDDFVVEVCRTLGAKVERIDHSEGEEASMIVDFAPGRVAVLTRAEDHIASSATIQLAIASRVRHHCESCAVIINRRFTGAAQDFAQRNACAAIGTSEFPDFVMGKIEL